MYGYWAVLRTQTPNNNDLRTPVQGESGDFVAALAVLP
jgi:hypothetical protein